MTIRAPRGSAIAPGAWTAAPAVHSFGPFRIDLSVGQLFVGGRPVRLRPKTWAVLLYLASRPQVLVTRDAILDAVWPGVAVTPDTLTKSIAELRAALGDDSRAPRFLETVHRRGFRFIAGPTPAAPVRAAGRDPLPIPGPKVRQPAPACFVGREHEMRVLVDHFTAACAGERQVVFVTGPAGVGKTALVDAVLASRAIGELGSPVWIGRAVCVEQHGPQEPYMPVLDALQGLVRPPNVERVVALLRRAAPLWLAQMPWLLSERDAAALRRSLQGTRPERMPRELANLIETLTAELTLVLVLENLHWSDPATVDLLTLLAQRRAPARLLVIATYRRAEVAVGEHALGPAVRALRAHGRCTELTLTDLPCADIHRFLDRRFPGHAFPPAFADQLHAHTGGAPLYVVALTEHLLSRGQILDTAPGWALGVPLEKVDLGVPDDIRHLLVGQFHDLLPGERAVLEAASVAGPPIVAGLLAAALGCSREATEELCESLARSHRFLAVAGTHQWPDGTSARRYAFTHELHRRVVYDETAEERRIRLHAAIGRALERAQGDRVSELAPQLAAHFNRGHDAARTLHYLTVAGRRARERFASREARQYLERALALVDTLDDPAERQRREVEVRLALGRALGDLHGFAAETVRENYERVSAVCRTTGSAAQAFEALYARWYVHALRAERAPTLALADELAYVAAQLATPGYAVLADATLVRTAYYDGRFADAVRHMGSLRDNVARHPAATMPIAYGIEPVLAATTHCAGATWFLGDAEGARAMMRGAVAGARDTGNPFFLTGALTPAAQLEVLIGNDDAADDLATESEAVAASQGFSMWQAYAACWKAQARLRRGDPVDGSRGIEHALAVMGATDTRLAVDFLQACLAEAHLRAGERRQGLAAVEAGLQAVAEGRLCNCEPDLWRLKAELLLTAPAPPIRAPRRSRGAAPRAALDGEWPEAERCFRRAAERARASGATSLELRAALGLGRAWLARGRTRDAHALLAAICARFDPASTAPDLLSARALQQAIAAGR